MTARDRILSAIRAALQRRDRFDYEQRYLAHGQEALMRGSYPHELWCNLCCQQKIFLCPVISPLQLFSL